MKISLISYKINQDLFELNLSDGTDSNIASYIIDMYNVNP